MATKRSIILNGLPTRYNEEGVAAEAITPGKLVSGVTSIALNDTTSGQVPFTIACEREEMGDDIDVDYAIGDAVKVASVQPGCVVLVWIPSGHTVSADTRLEPVANGNMGALASGVAIARSLETLGAVLVPTRCRAEVI